MEVVEEDLHTLTINGHTVTFKQEIDDYSVMNDRVTVVLAVTDFADSDPKRARNVIALDERGETLWRISASGQTTVSNRGERIRDGFEFVWLTETGGLAVATTGGIAFDVDPRTGKLSNKRDFELWEAFSQRE